MAAPTVRIFVEGIADKKFISDYLNFHFNIEFKEILEINGKTEENIIMVKNKFNENTDQSGVNLLIVDADEDYNSSFKNLFNTKKKHKIFFDLFLLPNNRDNGQLEDILINIVPSNNKIIFECFEEYQNCLKKDKRFTIPQKKAMIYAYLETLLDKSKIKFAQEKNRDYKNIKHWDLYHEYLKPLNNFLGKYFK